MAFLVSFLVSRGIFSHFVVYYPLVSAEDLNLIPRVSLALLWALSTYLCYLVGLKLKQRMQEVKEMRSEGVELQWLAQDHYELCRLSFYRKAEDKVF